MKTCIVALIVGAGVAANAVAGTAFFNGALTTASPTTHVPGTSTTAPAIQYYNAQAFTVDVSGTYTFESASPNTNPATAVSNALDTFIAIYAGSFNAATPGAPGTSNDDFTGALTVLPGPYAGTVAPATTGFTGLQPGSRTTLALTAGTTYYFVNTSFRQVGYVNSIAAQDGDEVGNYYSGISGQGNVTLVPAPASVALLGLGGLVAARRRRA